MHLAYNWGKGHPDMLFRGAVKTDQDGGEGCPRFVMRSSKIPGRESARGGLGVHAEFKSLPKLQQARQLRTRVSPWVRDHTPASTSWLELALFTALPTSSRQNITKAASRLLLDSPLLTSCVPWGVRAARKPGQIPRKPAPRQWK